MHKNAIFSYKLLYSILLDSLTCILYSTNLQSDNIKFYMPNIKTLPIYIVWRRTCIKYVFLTFELNGMGLVLLET